MTDWGSRVLEFVRGDLDHLGFEEMGITLVETDASIVLHEPAGVPRVAPTARDVARGLVVHYARSSDLRDWARLVLAASFIDLSALGSTGTGQVVLEALWSASEGAALSSDALRVLNVTASSA